MVSIKIIIPKIINLQLLTEFKWDGNERWINIKNRLKRSWLVLKRKTLKGHFHSNGPFAINMRQGAVRFTHSLTAINKRQKIGLLCRIHITERRDKAAFASLNGSRTRIPWNAIFILVVPPGKKNTKTVWRGSLAVAYPLG